MDIEQLQSAAASAAPGPQDLSSLQQAGGASSGPPPMELEQLQSMSASAAPGPQDLATLGAADETAGPPVPVSLEELGPPPKA